VPLTIPYPTNGSAKAKLREGNCLAVSGPLRPDRLAPAHHRVPDHHHGLVLGIKSLSGPPDGMAVAGIVLCIIGLVATTANAAIGAYLGATGQLHR